MYINEAKSLLKEIYRAQIETGERFSVELVSGPGLGKSAIIGQVCRELSEEWGVKIAEKPFFLTTVEPPDVRGFGLPDKDPETGKRIMTFTEAPWMPTSKDPEHGIVFLDEFGQAQPDVAKPAAELLLNGRVGSSQLPITWIVVAASNREKDRSGVQKGLAFIENRKCRINIEPNLDAWVEWAETEGINPWAIAFAKVKPALVFKDEVPEKPGPFCTPRTLVKISHLIGRLSQNRLFSAVTGYFGEGTAAEFIAFLRVAEELPKYEEIVANPAKCRLPDKNRPDAQYATMQMIAHRVDEKTCEKAFEYLLRMPKEFQVSGLKAALRRIPAMSQTKEFMEWIRANKDLVMAANVLDRK